MELWYTQPAVDWNAALPAGNGRLGCMQFGGVARERFQLNEDSLWSGGPMHRLNPDASATLPKVQELLRQGRLPDAERLALDGLASTPCGMRAYQPLGDLTLDFDGLPAEADDYCRGLDLDAGTLYVRFTVGGAHYAREASGPAEWGRDPGHTGSPAWFRYSHTGTGWGCHRAGNAPHTGGASPPGISCTARS